MPSTTGGNKSLLQKRRPLSESIPHGYEKCAAKYSDTSDQATLKALEQLKNDKEAVEMELQHSMFNDEGGISLKIPPDYLGLGV